MKKVLQLSMIVGLLATLTGCGDKVSQQSTHKKEEKVAQSSKMPSQAKSSLIASKPKSSQTSQSSQTSSRSDSYWTAQQQQQLVEYMTKWGEQQHTSFSQNPLESHQNVVRMNDLTITDHPKGDKEAKLSIDSQLIDVHVGGSNDKGYHIVSAFSGTSSDFSHLRYLFVLHDGSPEVLVSDISKSIGPANGEPAVNFVKTSDQHLQNAFANIIKHQPVDMPSESSQNVVNSIDEAKGIYKEIYGTEPSSEGKWFVRNGTYIYAWRDSNFGSERSATTIFPNGSVEHFTAGGGAFSGGKCTYDDVKNGTAKKKLNAMSNEALENAGIVDPFAQYNLSDQW